MGRLVEEVEHQLRLRRRAPPSRRTSSPGASRGSTPATTAHEPLAEGDPVLFDFGAVWNGYCSDFGRTIPCGAPPSATRKVQRVLLEAQEAGRAAAGPGALAREVNAACRRLIEGGRPRR